MKSIESIKRRLDKVREQERGQVPSAKQVALAGQYAAALFGRMKELRASIKAHAQGVSQ